jgi:hypothetical protein
MDNLTTFVTNVVLSQGWNILALVWFIVLVVG